MSEDFETKRIYEQIDDEMMSHRMADKNKHTKLVEVPQQREWQETGPQKYSYVYEDGYDAIAEVKYINKLNRWQWWNASGEYGMSDTKQQAIKATGYDE